MRGRATGHLPRNAHLLETFKFECRSRIGAITLNRPEIRNAFDSSMATALGSAINAIEADPELRAGLLQGAITKPRPVFWAGLDGLATSRRLEIVLAATSSSPPLVRLLRSPRSSEAWLPAPGACFGSRGPWARPRRWT
ncbi:enoyl-CoA hydratase-related protein [Nocardia vinacea]|uniref:enoyl-CoA hydratase-related protein n=1 Tax=Nocardia vinacea TaxID=96468 RepID=UPI003AF3603F